MIVGIGVDLVDVERFRRSLSDTPALRERLFTHSELTRSDQSLAGRFAAKEALVKALGGPVGNWREVSVESSVSGAPRMECTGAVAERLSAAGVDAVHVSISHDGGFATAYVVLESRS